MQAAARVNLRISIKECRRVYRDMTDAEFATWYSKRYKVLPEMILEILNSEK